MEYRNFGSTGVKVSPICLGTAFRGTSDEATARAAIERALDLGVNFIDCANVYQKGWSEEVLGKALKGRRDRFVVTTKVCSPVGDGPNDRGLSRFHIMREIDKSLARLQMDHVDFYLVHQVDPNTPIDETLLALDDVVRQGKVRYVGCCNFAAWQVCKALWTSDRLHLTPFVAVQNHYNLLDRAIEQDLIPFCRAEGLAMMIYSPVAVGLLTGRFRHGAPPPPGTPWSQREDRFAHFMTPESDRVVEALLRIGRERDKTPAQVAIAWVLSHPEIGAAMIGPDSAEHVEENVGGAGWSLSPEERAALDEASSWAVKDGRR